MSTTTSTAVAVETSQTPAPPPDQGDMIWGWAEKAFGFVEHLATGAGTTWSALKNNADFQAVVRLANNAATTALTEHGMSPEGLTDVEGAVGHALDFLAAVHPKIDTK